jgi:hypothetical protein
MGNCKETVGEIPQVEPKQNYGKKRITLPDGRYLIYYRFEEEESSQESE